MSGRPEFEVIGYDEFDGEEYSLGDPPGTPAMFDDHDLALDFGRVRLAYLERAQPASSSGGQEHGGIQDRVYIVHPNGQRERVFSAMS
jgi:hypothetical protein